MKKTTTLVAFVLICHCFSSFAQTVDQNFKIPLALKAADIADILLQPDGKILLCGNIRYYGSRPVGNIIRINSDGTLDESFNFLIEAPDSQNRVAQILMQSDGDIVFRTFAKLGLISSTGTMKNSVTYTSLIVAICIQPDDKIVIGANYGVNLLRFNQDLSADQVFNDAISIDDGVSDIEYYDNHLIIAGYFSEVNGVTKHNLARLDLTGALDQTFDAGTGTQDYIGNIQVQADGKILLTNSYINNFNSVPAHGLIRLNQNGSIDSGFTPPYLYGPTSEAAFQGGKILICSYLGGLVRLIRLNSDGTQDQTFQTVSPSSLSSIMVAGNNFYSNNIRALGNHFGLCKFSTDGDVDNAFLIEPATFASVTCGDIFQDKFVIGGDFLKIGDFTTYGLAKLNADGSVDQSFKNNVYPTKTKPFDQIKILDDHSLLATNADLIKLDFSGNEVPGFDFVPFKELYEVWKFIVLNDGKIVAGGPNNIYRLNQNGSEDQSFDIGTGSEGYNGTLFDIAIQSSGKIIYGGLFSSYNGVPANRLVRLEQDATVDPTFNIGAGPDDDVAHVKVLTGTDEMLVSGFITKFDNVSVTKRLVKLSADGQISSAFNNNLPNTTPSFIRSITEMSDKILLHGYPEGIGSVIAINRDGTLHVNFELPSIITSLPTVASVVTSGNDIYLLGEGYLNGSPEPWFVMKLIPSSNVKPGITATSLSSITEDTPITLTIGNFTINDPDNTSNDFVLTLIDGEHYSIEGNKLIPDQNYFGTLTAKVKVSDGVASSIPFEFQLSVTAVNDAPTVTAAVALTTPEDTPVILTVGNFTINDPDNTSNDFVLTLIDGEHYSIEGNKLIPDQNYFGTLTAIVKVSDGIASSIPFEFQLSVTAVNDAPTVTAAVALTIPEDTPITLTIGNFTINDPDNTSNDFVLTLIDGEHYSIEGNKLIPDQNYFGTLTAIVKVSDGVASSNPFEFQLSVTAVNDAPTVTAAVALTTPEDTPVILTVGNFTINDPDNTSNDFVLTLIDGEHYSIEGNKLIPDQNYFGTLTAIVKVSDGIASSIPFEFQLSVTAVNDAPTVTATVALTTPEDTPVTLTVGNFTINDPDNTSNDFVLTLIDGEHYSIEGNKLIPDQNYFGTLTAIVKVSDGIASSIPFEFQLSVTEVNDAPTVTAAVALTTPEDTPITLTVGNFTINDPDNASNDFVLTLIDGEHYSIEGNKLIPDQNYFGTLTAIVKVSDGVASSNPFEFQLSVTAVNDAPTVTAAVALTTPEDTPITLTVGNFTINDPDNTSNDFVLTLIDGEHYSIEGNKLIPDQNYFGTLTAKVKVSDGVASSNPFEFPLTITSVNDAPVITGSVSLSGQEDTSLTLTMENFIVSDFDSPENDLVLKLLAGEHYQIEGNKLTPESNFFGTLVAKVKVSDGITDSEPYSVQIIVTPVNDAPVITAVATLSTHEDVPLVIKFDHFTVIDPDNVFPTGFTITISAGENYRVQNTTITPDTNFKGTLRLSAKVNDGVASSAAFTFQVQVLSVNDIPVIESASTGLIIIESNPFELSLANFVVNDPDNDYPKDFSFTIQNGLHYTFSNHSILPEVGFKGTLNVPVIVSDGIDESSPFSVPILVDIATGIEDHPGYKLQVFPNPTREIVNIYYNGSATITKIQLIDASGRELGIGIKRSDLGYFADVRSLQQGMYFIKIITEREMVVRKIQKID